MQRWRENPIWLYLGLTLVVPLLGGRTGPGFWEHALTVLVIAGPFGLVFHLANAKKPAPQKAVPVGSGEGRMS